MIESGVVYSVPRTIEFKFHLGSPSQPNIIVVFKDPYRHSAVSVLLTYT
jgi:hypothetical protein